MFVDPTGMSSETVIIKGDLAEAATEQLNNSTEGQLNITRNKETGKLSYTKTSEGPLSKDAQQLANAIDDKNITVNVEASSSTTSSKTGKDLAGGEFQGSKTDFDGLGNAITDTYQQVNPNQTNNYDYANGTSGKAAQHEVVESYLGGQEAQKRGLSRVGPATKADANNPRSVYRVSHDSAPVGHKGKTYIEKGTNRTYVKTSWGAKVYINEKK